MMSTSANRERPQLLLKFLEGSDLRERLENVARANNRSLTAEILFRLEASLSVPAYESLSPMASEIDALREEIRAETRERRAATKTVETALNSLAEAHMLLAGEVGDLAEQLKTLRL